MSEVVFTAQGTWRPSTYAFPRLLSLIWLHTLTPSPLSTKGVANAHFVASTPQINTWKRKCGMDTAVALGGWYLFFKKSFESPSNCQWDFISEVCGLVVFFPATLHRQHAACLPRLRHPCQAPITHLMADPNHTRIWNG